MAPFGSRIGPLLLVAGLSSGATLALCVFCLHTLGPTAGQDSAGRAKALFATAVSPLQPESQAHVILPTKDFKPRLLQENSENYIHLNETWGPNGKCDFTYHLDTHVFSFSLQTGECEFSRMTFRGLANPVAMFVAFIIDLIWHIVHCYRKTGRHAMNPALRELSLGVLIFNIFYNPSLPKIMQRNPFSFTCLILSIEAFVFRGIDCYKHKEQRKKTQGPESQSDDMQLLTLPSNDMSGMAEPLPSHKDPDDLSDVKIYNRYQMMSLRFTSILMLFVCQLSMGLFYVYSLNNREEGWKSSSGFRWLIGTFLCNLAGEKEFGKSFHLPFWLKLLGNKKEMEGNWEGQEEQLAARSRVCFVVPLRYRHQAMIRMMMSIVVNLFIRRIIFCTAPILLGVANDPLEFLKDSLAVFFITKLDDLDRPMSFLGDLKRKANYDGSSDECQKTLFGTAEVFEEEDATNARITAIEKRIKVLEEGHRQSPSYEAAANF